MNVCVCAITMVDGDARLCVGIGYWYLLDRFSGNIL